MWDKKVVEKLDECVGDYTVATSFTNVEDRYQWSFAGVYGPNTNTERRSMWDELVGLCSLWSLPWCIGGDFNFTRFPSKRLGGPSSSLAMTDFSNFIMSKIFWTFL